MSKILLYFEPYLTYRYYIGHTTVEPCKYEMEGTTKKFHLNRNFILTEIIIFIPVIYKIRKV